MSDAPPETVRYSDAEKASDWDACWVWLNDHQRGLDPLTELPYPTMQQRLVAAICEAMWNREGSDA